MTTELYLENTYLFAGTSDIISRNQDAKGHYIIFDQTIFYPQGGGQPCDQGTIEHGNVKIKISSVRKAGESIHHYIDMNQGYCQDVLKVGTSVTCILDKERRLMNSRYHTAGHLLGNVVEQLYPGLQATKGHSFPGEAYIEFNSDREVDRDEIQNAVNEAITRDLKTKIFDSDPLSFEAQFYQLPYKIPENKKFRVMQIATMMPVPCGGTHLRSIGEIGYLNIDKIKHKNNFCRISYRVP